MLVIRHIRGLCGSRWSRLLTDESWDEGAAEEAAGEGCGQARRRSGGGGASCGCWRGGAALAAQRIALASRWDRGEGGRRAEGVALLPPAMRRDSCGRLAQFGASSWVGGDVRELMSAAGGLQTHLAALPATFSPKPAQHRGKRPSGDVAALPPPASLLLARLTVQHHHRHTYEVHVRQAAPGQVQRALAAKGGRSGREAGSSVGPRQRRRAAAAGGGHRHILSLPRCRNASSAPLRPFPIHGMPMASTLLRPRVGLAAAAAGGGAARSH